MFMNQVKKCKLPAIKSIQHNGQPCLELEDLWQVLHLAFNLAQSCQISLELLEEISNKAVMMWTLFSKEEFQSVIFKCNNLSTLGLNKLSWRHFKVIINNYLCLKNFINIANTCQNISYCISKCLISSLFLSLIRLHTTLLRCSDQSFY